MRYMIPCAAIVLVAASGLPDLSPDLEIGALAPGTVRAKQATPVGKAHTVHGNRRSERRVTREHEYRRTLPRGCRQTANDIWGNTFWRCGSTYFQERTVSGARVYEVVVP